MADLQMEAQALADELRDAARRVESLAGLEAGIDTGARPQLSPAKRLELARSRAGLTQHRLAELSGVSVNTIVNFENGRSQPRIRTLMALADALSISWEELHDDE